MAASLLLHQVALAIKFVLYCKYLSQCSIRKKCFIYTQD